MRETNSKFGSSPCVTVYVDHPLHWVDLAHVPAPLTGLTSGPEGEVGVEGLSSLTLTSLLTSPSWPWPWEFAFCCASRSCLRNLARRFWNHTWNRMKITFKWVCVNKLSRIGKQINNTGFEVWIGGCFVFIRERGVLIAQ